MAGIRFVGLLDVADQYEAMADALDSGEVIQAAGQQWIDQTFVPQAQRDAPVDTGEYRDKIGGRVEGTKIVLTADAEHSDVVEVGTSTSPAFGTMQHTLEITIDALVREIDLEIERRLK